MAGEQEAVNLFPYDFLLFVSASFLIYGIGLFCLARRMAELDAAKAEREKEERR